jgi:hypothetical protein
MFESGGGELAAKERREHNDLEKKAFLSGLCVVSRQFPSFARGSGVSGRRGGGREIPCVFMGSVRIEVGSGMKSRQRELIARCDEFGQAWWRRASAAGLHRLWAFLTADDADRRR